MARGLEALAALVCPVSRSNFLLGGHRELFQGRSGKTKVLELFL
jgi:hypothetical protein